MIDIISKPYPGSALTPGTSTPGETRQSFGGVGRNVAEGLARVLLPTRRAVGSGGAADNDGKENVDDGRSPGAEISLIAAVGADDAGRALVAGCEEVGINARGTVEVRPDGAQTKRGSRDGGGAVDCAGTASYVAVLGGDGELVAAVADMRIMEKMTAVSTLRKRVTLARFSLSNGPMFSYFSLYQLAPQLAADTNRTRNTIDIGAFRHGEREK